MGITLSMPFWIQPTILLMKLAMWRAQCSGGRLGASLGPAGAVAGSLVGGWLGRQLGHLLQGDGNRTRSNQPVAPPFLGGQMAGVYYRIVADASVNGPAVSGAVQIGYAYGPILGFAASHDTYESDGITYYNGQVELLAADGPVTFQGYFPYTALASYSNFRSQQTINADVIEITRVDGQPDTGGNPYAPPIPIITPPSYPLTPTGEPLWLPTGKPLPSPTDKPLRLPTDDWLPLPTSTPLPTVEPLPSPTGKPLPSPTGGPGLDVPPAPDDLPGPRPQRPAEPTTPINPNPEPDCCQINGITINRLLIEVQHLTEQFQVFGVGAINMPDCNTQTPDLLPWTGSGLTGIYQALEQLSNATSKLWEQVKCPPEALAAVPMAWETKVKEHPQLIVIWGPTEGKHARWSMHIPHPKRIVSETYEFQFPTYTKGPVRGCLILSDNSRLVVNGASEAECTTVISYCKTLIETQYLEGSHVVFTKGVANHNVVVVKATYIKKFAGHRDQVPLWAKSL